MRGWATIARMRMRAELVVNATAGDAWVVVGERFGEIGEWASAITESVMDGPPAVGHVRTCRVAGFGPIAAGVIKERLTQFDPEAKSLSYEAAGLPWFITRSGTAAGGQPRRSRRWQPRCQRGEFAGRDRCGQ